jgi:transposase
MDMPGILFGSDPGAAALRRLARRESGRVYQRVLMIANMLEGMKHEAAARLAGLRRSAAYEWHNRYEEDGIEGLRDRPRPGRQPRVDAATSARFKEWIVAGAALERDGVVAFRGVDAQRRLKEEFGIDCSLSSTYRLLHRINLSWPRVLASRRPMRRHKRSFRNHGIAIRASPGGASNAAGESRYGFRTRRASVRRTL